jgi:Arc/MetJ-type ribon-helix-helix transcriptional regulator
MNLVISETTQKLLEERMKKGGYGSPDEAVRKALEMMDQLDAEDIDDETFAAIEKGISQANRDEGQPWEQVREELRSRYGLK